MRAVVVEIKDNDTAVLSEDGRILKIKNNGYTMGQEIILKKSNRYIKVAVSAVGVLVLFAISVWAYLIPFSHVSLDVNPHFEFSVNVIDRVLEVNAVNDEGEKLIVNISVQNLKNKKINEAVKTVLIELRERSYINEDEKTGVVVVTSSKSKKKRDELTASLESVIEEVNFKAEREDQNKENKVNEEIVPETEDETKINDKMIENEKVSESEAATEQEIMTEPISQHIK